MNNNSFDEINRMYPYGQFPTNYTVLGQEKMREELKKRGTYEEANSYIHQTDSNRENARISQYNNMPQNAPRSSIMNLKNLLPLLVKMQNGGVDARDLVKFVSPMMSSDLPMADILSMITKNDSTKMHLSEDASISSIKRCSD